MAAVPARRPVAAAAAAALGGRRPGGPARRWSGSSRWRPARSATGAGRGPPPCGRSARRGRPKRSARAPPSRASAPASTSSSADGRSRSARRPDQQPGVADVGGRGPAQVRRQPVAEGADERPQLVVGVQAVGVDEGAGQVVGLDLDVGPQPPGRCRRPRRPAPRPRGPGRRRRPGRRPRARRPPPARRCRSPGGASAGRTPLRRG